MYTNVHHIGITPLCDGHTYRVTLRDARGVIIRDNLGELEQADYTKGVANREAKRLAKAYNVQTKVY